MVLWSGSSGLVVVVVVWWCWCGGGGGGGGGGRGGLVVVVARRNPADVSRKSADSAKNAKVLIAEKVLTQQKSPEWTNE